MQSDNENKSISEKYLRDVALAMNMSYLRLIELMDNNPYFTTDEKLISHYEVVTNKKY